MDGGAANIDVNPRHYPLLFEMLRSFITLASTLNLSHAVAELGSTRQTVRRHITQLEELKGGPLFEVANRQYSLSELGLKVLPEALDLLDRTEAWIGRRFELVDGLQHLGIERKDGWYYYQHQHPIGRAFSSTGTLLQDAIRAWSEAKGEVEHESLQRIRPYGQIFRRSDGDWRFTEVGELSSVTRLLGWKFARSTIGRSLGQMPGGESFDRLTKHAYAEVEQTQALRLDHCLTVLPQPDVGKNTPVCFERLLLGSWFADGSFAVLSVVRLTHDVEIKGVTDDMLQLMPESLLMD